MTRPLEGIRVLDMGRIIAGPYCAALLGDLGAEVIKVESIDGEDSRQFLPMKEGVSLYFAAHNRGKKSVTLNMRKDAAKEIFRKLTENSDVVVENFKPGVMAAMGFDYPKLAAINPRIILTSVSGFGQTGPYAERVAMDSVIQAMSGWWASTGYPEQPMRVGGNPGDYISGLFGAYAPLAALNQRHITGRGQHVDYAMFDGMVTFLCMPVMEQLACGTCPPRVGNASPLVAPSNLYKAKDGFILILAGVDGHFHRLLEVIGRPDLKDDPRLLTRTLRIGQQAFIDDLVSRWVAERNVAEIAELLDAANVPNGPLREISEVATDPQVQARELFQEVESPEGVRIPVPGVVAKLSDMEQFPPRRPSAIGEHNREVYGSLLGYSDAELERFKDEGAT